MNLRKRRSTWAARALAGQVDVFYVIGGRHSSNSVKLLAVCQEQALVAQVFDHVQIVGDKNDGRAGRLQLLNALDAALAVEMSTAGTLERSNSAGHAASSTCARSCDTSRGRAFWRSSPCSPGRSSLFFNTSANCRCSGFIFNDFFPRKLSCCCRSSASGSRACLPISNGASRPGKRSSGPRSP